MQSRSCSLGAHDFRVCFTPFERVLFTFPSRYSCAIGQRLVFSLGGWAPRIRTGFHVSRPTQASRPPAARFRARGCHPLRRAFPGACAAVRRILCGILQPRGMNPPVWAGPRSLAATGGISFDFLSWPGSQGSPCGVAPFGDPRVTGRLRLAVEYRRLPRPSSPSAAKASVMRPKSLSAEILSRGRASGLSRCPCGKPRAERARAPPSAFYVTFKVFLSFASGCQRAPPPRRAAGGNSGMVGAPGLEPGTSSLSEKRSNQLSYAPAGTWWSRRDSNPRHPACKAGALPAELRPPRRAPAPRESSGAIRDGHRPRRESRGFPYKRR